MFLDIRCSPRGENRYTLERAGGGELIQLERAGENKTERLPC